MRQTVRFTLALAVVAFGMVAAGRAQPPTTPPAKAVTFDDVVRQLRAGRTPGEILENCDVVFTLTPVQRNELLKAGAPKSLVDALQVKRVAIGDVTDWVVILDCSGSMKDAIGPGQTKMDAAKTVVGELFRAIPNGRNLAFIVYGHDAALECRAVKVVRPLGPVDDEARRELASAAETLQPAGHTPIAASLRAAGEVLAKSGAMSQVVLITDGVETCKGDPAAEAEKLVAAVKGLRAVEVIGVGLTKPGEKEAVALIARRGRGKFYDPETAADLKRDIEGATGVKLVKGDKGDPPAEDRVPEDLPPAVRALVDDLKDKSGRVRREAADALAKLGEKAKPTAPALAARVADDVFDSVNSFTRNGDPDGGCKAAALEALQKLAPDRVEGALLKARKSKNEQIRAWATKKLGELAKRAEDESRPADRPPAEDRVPEDLPPAVRALVDDLKDKSGRVRREAADALAKLGEKAKPTAPALAARVADDVFDSVNSFTRNGDPDGGCKAAALEALQKLAPDRVEGALLKARKSKNEQIRAWATKKLGELSK